MLFLIFVLLITNQIEGHLSPAISPEGISDSSVNIAWKWAYGS